MKVKLTRLHAGLAEHTVSKAQGRIQDVCEVSGLHSGTDGATVQWNRRHEPSGLEGRDNLCLEHAQCAVPLGHLGEGPDSWGYRQAPLEVSFLFL